MHLSLAILLFIAASASVAAQATPTFRSSPDASHYILRSGREIGEGWVISDKYPLDREGTSLGSAYAGAYGGPKGHRAYIAAWEGESTEQSRAEAWSTGGEFFDAAQLYFFDPEIDSEAQRAGEPLPDGCFAARRVTGVANPWGIPSAAILCATEQNVVVLVIFSGILSGKGAMTSAEQVLATSLEIAREIQGTQPSN